MRKNAGTILGILMLGLAAWLGWAVWQRLAPGGGGGARSAQAGPAPVEVAQVEHGPLESRRMFSGTLEARSKFAVASKVGGRIERLHVDLADTVRKGQVVALLDDDEFEQEAAQAQADLAVAEAHVAEAKSALTIAEREFERVQTLQGQKVASEAQLDSVRAERLAAEAAVKVADARARRAEAEVQTARIRLGYTKVTVDWSGEDTERVVAERFVDEGDTVSANTSLLSVVRLDPITGVVHATEKDYGRLQPGQKTTLKTDAYPARAFAGNISRISPVFRHQSRQARVELEVENSDRMLKPGMFVRAEVVLDRVEGATIVPADSLVTREGQSGVFLVDEAGKAVRWCAVETGIREGGRVQVTGEGIEGRVVTLGQQLLDDGSPITIPDNGQPESKSGASP